MKKLPGGIYVITDEHLMARKDFIKKITEAASAGAGLIQLREKTSRIRDRLALAKEAVKAAHSFGARIIINDDPWLAAAIDADGVHIGRTDGSVKTARGLLGHKAIIGVSCYGDIELALRSQKEGADYVSFGACFRSPTKPGEAVVPLSLFGEAKKRIKIPLVAIGGINRNNAPLVLAAGADMVSVVSAVFSRARVAIAIKEFHIKGENK